MAARAEGRGIPVAVALIVAIACAFVAHCAVSSDTILVGKACPCASDLGYVCDCSTNRCVKNTCEAGLGVYGGQCVDFSTNPSHCGACGNACIGVGNGIMGCIDGGCITLACAVPTSEPITYVDCDGGPAACTTAGLDFANCGSCGNDCRTQFAHSGSCSHDLPSPRCECNSDPDCNGGTCSDGGMCVCGAMACAYGERCVAGTGCSCNGGPACDVAAGEVCCVQPAGCVNVRNDSHNCGTCGVECPPGFACSPVVANGPGPRVACGCVGNASCNAGDSSARCDETTGLCICGSTADGGQTCSLYGQRCVVEMGTPQCG